MKKILSCLLVFVLFFSLAFFSLNKFLGVKTVLNSNKVESALDTDVTEDYEYHLSTLSLHTDLNNYLKATVSVGTGEDAYLSGENEITYPGLGVYTGEHKNLIRSGEGQFQWDDGNCYIGNWENDELSGYGELTYPGIGKYCGNYENSLRSGLGTFTWLIGPSYTGEWVDDKMCGSGTYDCGNGSGFKGVFFDNKFVDGIYSYEMPSEQRGMNHHNTVTNWTCDVSQGEVEDISFTCQGGMTFKGTLDSESGLGKARIEYPDGSIYEGEVLDGKRSGNGKMTWYTSRSGGKVKASYDGAWKNDTMNGTGTYYYSSTTYPYLTGTFKDGKPDGICTYYKASGNTFSTKWVDGFCTEVKES